MGYIKTTEFRNFRNIVIKDWVCQHYAGKLGGEEEVSRGGKYCNS
jgi:hypothetical protein